MAILRKICGEWALISASTARIGVYQEPFPSNCLKIAGPNLFSLAAAPSASGTRSCVLARGGRVARRGRRRRPVALWVPQCHALVGDRWCRRGRGIGRWRRGGSAKVTKPAATVGRAVPGSLSLSAALTPCSGRAPLRPRGAGWRVLRGQRDRRLYRFLLGRPRAPGPRMQQKGRAEIECRPGRRCVQLQPSLGLPRVAAPNDVEQRQPRQPRRYNGNTARSVHAPSLLHDLVQVAPTRMLPAFPLRVPRKAPRRPHRAGSHLPGA